MYSKIKLKINATNLTVINPTNGYVSVMNPLMIYPLTCFPPFLAHQTIFFPIRPLQAADITPSLDLETINRPF